MKLNVLILIIYGLVCLLSLIINAIKFKSNKNKYFKFNIVGVDSRKIEFAVKAKDFESAVHIIRETLCTKDSDKWFEISIEDKLFTV